ncbi:MAG: glycerate kinase [Gaiellaceae bacterium]
MTPAGRVLVCPDKFRGTLSAAEAATAIAAGLREAGVVDIVELPLADGGEGTLDVLLAARGGDLHEATVVGPDGSPAVARYGLLHGGVAIVEMAEASGLALVTGANNPLTATTYGTGQLIALAEAHGASSVIVGVGGSATVDGGRGALDALGWRSPSIPVVVACDVATLFLDAAGVFGPQKGAGPAEVAELSERLRLLAVEFADVTGADVRELPGAGAAGGLAGGLAALGATLRPGFAVVAEAVGFERHVDEAAIVVTGEGLLDRTSLAGKVVGEVLRAAKRRRIPAKVIAGDMTPGIAGALPGDVNVVSLVALAGSVEEARSRASALVTEAAALLVRRPA